MELPGVLLLEPRYCYFATKLIHDTVFVRIREDGLIAFSLVFCSGQ